MKSSWKFQTDSVPMTRVKSSYTRVSIKVEVVEDVRLLHVFSTCTASSSAHVPCFFSNHSKTQFQFGKFCTSSPDGFIEFLTLLCNFSESQSRGTGARGSRRVGCHRRKTCD